jgi:diguanylate cyclase
LPDPRPAFLGTDPIGRTSLAHRTRQELAGVCMKKWVEKLVEQFDVTWSDSTNGTGVSEPLSEDRATLLFLIDTYNKHLLEIAGHPVRRVRETLDEFAKQIVSPHEGTNLEKVMFRFRQFFGGYRIDECAYIQKTIEEFRTIIYDFVDQLGEDVCVDQADNSEIRIHLEQLKEAVESNSIELLKNQSRKFIDCYIEKQFTKEKRSAQMMKGIRKTLHAVKKQLDVANDTLKIDHLTHAYNRRSFDEFCAQQRKLYQIDQAPITMMLVDIDYFKRINDTFGHQVGDYVLKELVSTLKSLFINDHAFIARIGGEEFAIVLPEWDADKAMKRAQEILAKIKGEIFVIEEHKIGFTVSIGISQLTPTEDVGSWIKRADTALYRSKNNGRDRATLAPALLNSVA